MVDSVLVAVGGEVAAWVTDLVVVPDAGCEREQAERDAAGEAGQGAGAVAFESELAFASPEHRFDPLANRSEGSVAARFVFAVGAQEAGAAAGHELLELFAREAFVGDDGVSGDGDASEQLGGNITFGDVGGGELKADRHPVRGAEQVEPEAPEVARVAAAVAIAGVPGELRASRGLARWPHGTGVESSSLSPSQKL